MDYDLEVYDLLYYDRSDGIRHWCAGKMRYGDSLAAIAYVLGVPSFESFRALYGFSGLGKAHNEDLLTAVDQLAILKQVKTRDPKMVLDVGGGRGEASCALRYLGYDVQMIEPHPAACIWVKATWDQYFPHIKEDVILDLIQEPIPECLPGIDLDKLDTVMFVESLEHIPEENFNKFWPVVKAALMNNKGMLVCANWLDYHPLIVENREHCRHVDDTLYSEMAEGGNVLFMSGSHLVVQY